MIYLPAVLAVGFYFEKKRALANGIASSGSGIGTFVFSPLIEGLINSYTWRGTMLILSAVVMNTLLCGAVFRPIEPIRSKRKADKTDDLIDDEKRVSLIENEQPIEPLPDLLQSVPKRQLNMAVFPAIQKQLNENKTTHESHLNVDIKSPLYVHSLSTIPQNNHTGFGNLLKSTLLKQQFGSQDKTNVYRSLENGLHNVKQYRQPKASEHHDVKTNKPDDDILQNPLYRKDVFYSGSLTHLPEYVNSPSSKSYIKSMLSLPTSDSGDSTESIRSKFWRKMKRIFHQPLLRDPLFVMYMLPCVLWTSHSTIITYIPDYALSSGMSKSQAAMLISVIGITNTVGRIFIGWFADRDYVNCIILNALALLIAGSATMVLPFLPSYWYMLTYASIFGLCMSTWVSLRPIILVELLGIEQLTSAFGLLAMFQGIAFSIGPPIAGIMYDIGQSYTSPLVASGIMFASAGILSVLLKPILSRRNKLRHSWTSESLNSSLFDIPAKEALLVDQDEIWKHDENLEQNEILKQDEISKKDVISKQDDVWKQAEIWIKRKDIP
ncbi:unnamed protein product [Owenia fusiformis]|nr:unnamed protein product [Owenia fusiformis]